MSRVRFHWKTFAGKEARRALEAWGEVVRERRASGDPSAFPRGSFEFQSALGDMGKGHGRGNPGDMPGISAKYSDVEISLRDWSGTPWMRLLLNFVFVDGAIDVPFIVRDNGKVAEGVILYVMPDGSTVELDPSAPAPKGYADVRYGSIVRYKYNFDEFVCPAIDDGIRLLFPSKARRFLTYRRRFLERTVMDFAEFLAIRRGYGERKREDGAA